MPADVHDVMLATVVEVPMGKPYPGRMSVQADTPLPEAVLVVPVGQVSTTALALYTPDEATYAAVNALGLISGFAEKAPTRPGQYVPAALHCVTLAV